MSNFKLKVTVTKMQHRKFLNLKVLKLFESFRQLLSIVKSAAYRLKDSTSGTRLQAPQFETSKINDCMLQINKYFMNVEMYCLGGTLK